MKIMLPIIFLMLSCSLYCQEIPKKANTLAIRLGYDSALSLMLDKGYEIDKKDNDLKTFQTEYREIKHQENISIKVYCRVKDSLAYFSGIAKFTNSNLIDPSLIENRGMKGSLLQKSFEALNNLVLSFSLPVNYIINSNL